MLGWSQDQLAEASKVAKATIANFETGKREPYPRTLEDLRQALEAAGIEFTNGGQPGVRLKEGYAKHKSEIAPASLRDRMPIQVSPQSHKR